MASQEVDLHVPQSANGAPSQAPGKDLIRTASSSFTGKHAIARQSSIYSLTLDEFQNAIGEPGRIFGSMNMDDFLKNIWTAEESQAMAAAINTTDEPPGTWVPHANTANTVNNPTSISRQASLSLHHSLGRRTVEDVWKELARCGNGEIAPSKGQERQLTFGEMTLEDFLVKAGVIKEEMENSTGSRPHAAFQDVFEGGMETTSMTKGDGTAPETLSHGNRMNVKTISKDKDEDKPKGLALPTLSLSPLNASSVQSPMVPMQVDELKKLSPAPQQTDWMGADPRVGNGALMGYGMLGGGGVAGAELANSVSPGPLAFKTASPTSPMSDGIGHNHGALSAMAMSPLPYSLDVSTRGRKRGFAEGSIEKVVERRQKRMIKNRESAARSRARKQAYTVELESEVSILKEENMRLRMREEELADRRRQQFFELMSSVAPHLTPKATSLRKTQTGPW